MSLQAYKKVKHTVLLIILMFFSLQANAWVINSDFESGTVGQITNGNDGMPEAYSRTVYTNEQARSGLQAAKSTVRKGDDGFGEWGGLWYLPTKLGEGEELWYRVWVYFPSGFNFSCSGCSEGVKFMRTRTTSSGGAFEGSQDYYFSTNGMVMATGVNTTAFYNEHPWPYSDIRGIGEVISTGKWHAYEHYIKFSAVPGQGIMRAWQNGNLIFEDTVVATLKTSTSVAKEVTIWTYWNNLAPATQSAYLDDVIITNERPNKTDSYGNSFIGIEGVVAPKAPIITVN